MVSSGRGVAAGGVSESTFAGADGEDGSWIVSTLRMVSLCCAAWSRLERVAWIAGKGKGYAKR